MADKFLTTIGLSRRSHHPSADRDASASLPLYSPIAGGDLPSPRDSRDPSNDMDEIGNDQLFPAQRAATASAGRKAGGSLFALPTTARFLADFTLGFADGLTVPFALTAGLSSLGETETVIYAGMAEICAGSISMGIGGYLSARGEFAAAAASKAAAAAAAAASASGEMEMAADAEKGAALRADALVDEYLAPLRLPADLHDRVLAHVEKRPVVRETIVSRASSGHEDDGDDDEEDDERACSPVVVGLSVSLGYLLGGLLPLFPYFFVARVSDGLLWSFVVCVAALFVFGFSKDFAMGGGGGGGGDGQRQELRACRGEGGGGGVPWARVGRASWEGAQMVILGSVAAGAAVLCVRVFEGGKHAAAAEGGGGA
ncbi:uncharacterized protein E0L32_010413 [Thyridium curvatum]|uniref:Uncharacterized protein n=1 Tax=Thyridium curvatum TaxID=1093900 RepID=A0A507ASV7_9PEZI|nr:uncharacterized protein E0L32_010413 [Thyridium curvatum]TPX07958.1 hypothetical protein E0L32_010413 [Thyridium curvatum]